jgi:beta-lactamase class A
MKLTHRPVPLVLLVAMTAVLVPWLSGGLRAQAPAPGQAPAQAGALQRLLDAELSRIPAKAGIWVRHLKTGEQASVNGDERFNSASVIKIPVMVMAYQMAEAGRLDLQARAALPRPRPAAHAARRGDADDHHQR